MPDPDLALILGFITVMVLLITIGTVLTKAVENRGKRPTRELTEMSERLARIEHAVEAMSIEVERISEGQRFATKLLSERVQEPQRR